MDLRYIEPRTNPSYEYDIVLQDINYNFSGINAGFFTFSGGTVTGVTVFTGGLSATTFSAGTLFSGSTDLYSIFATIGSGGGSSTYVQPGSNITTGGTAGSPIVSLAASPSVNNLSFSGTATGVALSATTISGGTLFSGSTNLYSIFSPIGGGSSTYVQPGSNIATGGTANEPTVSLVASPSINGLSFSGTATGVALSATTISGGTLLSGSTNLYDIFSTTAANSGSGVGVFRDKTGSTLNFKSITSTGGTLSLEFDADTINIEVLGGALREKDTATTTGATTTLIGTITGMSISGTYIIESYVTASKSNDEYGTWKRTLGVTTTGGTPVLTYESADVDSFSTGFTPTSISYSANTGSTIDIYVKGIALNTYNWVSYYEVVDQGIAGRASDVPYITSRLTSSTAYTFSNGVNTLTVNTGSATTVSLLATPAVNDFFVVKSRQNTVLYPITVSGNGYNIDGSATLLINSANYPSYLFVFDGIEYIII